MAERKQIPNQQTPQQRQTMGGAVPTKPLDEGILAQLMALLAQQSPAPTPPSNPAQGVVDTVGRVMRPVKRGVDWLQGLGK